jgi:hypothetical protein
MFDGIKIRINDRVTHTRLLNNPALDFIGSHKKTGEVPTETELKENPRLRNNSAEYRGLIISVYDSETVIIRGSLHKYFNNGQHNYSQYCLPQIAETLQLLTTELAINPATARLQNLEFGVNLILPFNPDDLISNLIIHKTNTFNKFDIKDSNGRTTKREGRQYWLKIYDKGLHFDIIDSNILRFEIKAVKMEVIKKGEIFLTDLIKPNIINLCKERLIKAFDELIINEPLNISQLNDKDREFYKEYSNPRTWERLTPNQRNKKKEKYNNLLTRYSTHKIKEITRNCLIQTLQNITTIQPETGDVLTDLQNIQKGCSDHLSIMSKHPQPNQQLKYCITCGRELSGQKKGSKFCSELLFGKDAKKCRNVNSNPRNNRNRKIESIKSKGVLFDILPFIKAS